MPPVSWCPEGRPSRIRTAAEVVQRRVGLLIRAEEFCFVLEGMGRMRVGDETLTVPKYGGVLVGPDQLRQVFNDTDAEVLWLILGAPEELEFLQGSNSLMDLSLIYPVDPKQCQRNWPEWNGRRRRERVGWGR